MDSHLSYLAQVPASWERSCGVRDGTRFRACVSGVLAGQEAALGLFWQARLLGYAITVLSVNSEEGMEAICWPMSMTEHQTVTAGTTTDPVVVGRCTNHAKLRCWDFHSKVLRGHAVNASESSDNRNL